MTTGCRFKDEDLRRLEGGCVSGRVVKLKVSGVRTWCPTGRRLYGSEPQKGREDSGARGAAVPRVVLPSPACVDAAGSSQPPASWASTPRAAARCTWS